MTGFRWVHHPKIDLANEWQNLPREACLKPVDEQSHPKAMNVSDPKKVHP